MASDHDIGVLFVHGMGDQGRGDTVGQMGEAVAEWLRRETDGRSPNVTIRHASLKEVHPELNDAAEIHISFDKAITDEEDDAGKHPKRVARWLLAESWWAGSFRPASYLETAVWAISVGPWIVASQLDAVLSRTTNVALRVVLIVILGLSAGVAAALIAPLAVLLLVVALLPIPGLRDFVIGIQRNLSGSYGDLSILVRSPVRFASMWSTVLDDIEALSKHCDKVVVVAHSQGSAVGWMAIRRLADRILGSRKGDEASATMAAQVITKAPTETTHDTTTDESPEPPAPVATFISFGQALRKLKMLYLVNTESTFGERFFYLASAFVSTAALVLAFVTVANRLREGGLAGDWGPELLVLTVVGIVIIVIATVLAIQSRRWVERTEAGLKREAARVKAAMPELEWVDLWASADPATNGPLFADPPAWVSTHMIRNLGSTALDHTTYWSNTTEFVTEIVERAQATSANKVIVPRSIDDKRATVEARHARVQMLVVTRIAFVASFVATLLAIDATGIGRWVLETIGGLIGQPRLGGPAALIGYAVIAAVGSAAWLALLAAFNGIVSMDAAEYFTRGAPERQTVRLSAWWLVTAAILIATGWFLVENGDLRLLAGWAVATVGGIVLATTVLSRGGRTLAPPAPAAAESPESPGTQPAGTT